MRTILLASLASLVLVGCGDRDPGPSAETQRQSNRLEGILKRTKGDWDKLTPDERAFLVNELGHGNESTARALINPPRARLGGLPGVKR